MKFCIAPLTALPVLLLCFVELMKVKSLLRNPLSADCDSSLLKKNETRTMRVPDMEVHFSCQGIISHQRIFFSLDETWMLMTPPSPALYPSPQVATICEQSHNNGQLWRSAAAAWVHCQIQWAESLSTGPPPSLELTLISHILFQA